MDARENPSKPHLAAPGIDLAPEDVDVETLRMNLLCMSEAERAGVLKDLEEKLKEIHGEPIRKGSDRWVFLTDHVVYKIPSPQSYGAGQSGIFASLSEGAAGERQDPSLAACRLVHTPEGVPVVVMERVLTPTLEDMDSEQIGLNEAGDSVRYDAGGLGY